MYKFSDPTKSEGKTKQNLLIYKRAKKKTDCDNE